MTEVRSDAVVVPEDAILPLGSQSFAWVVAEGTASRREVSLGVRTPGFVEVREGVNVGEEVVVGGLQRLFEGAPVSATVIEREPTRVSPDTAVSGGSPPGEPSSDP